MSQRLMMPRLDSARSWKKEKRKEKKHYQLHHYYKHAALLSFCALYLNNIKCTLSNFMTLENLALSEKNQNIVLI